ncbi:hypothetical protein ACFY8Z_36685 [Streptomyces microflavus]|uniref:hypothetical protein n=1 Tax=Streptomyces microflavus TaxID=1919 RepID=UPI0036E73512
MQKKVSQNQAAGVLIVSTTVMSRLFSAEYNNVASRKQADDLVALVRSQGAQVPEAVVTALHGLRIKAQKASPRKKDRVDRLQEQMTALKADVEAGNARLASENAQLAGRFEDLLQQVENEERRTEGMRSGWLAERERREQAEQRADQAELGVDEATALLRSAETQRAEAQLRADRAEWTAEETESRLEVAGQKLAAASLYALESEATLNEQSEELRRLRLEITALKKQVENLSAEKRAAPRRIAETATQVEPMQDHSSAHLPGDTALAPAAGITSIGPPNPTPAELLRSFGRGGRPAPEQRRDASVGDGSPPPLRFTPLAPGHGRQAAPRGSTGQPRSTLGRRAEILPTGLDPDVYGGRAAQRRAVRQAPASQADPTMTGRSSVVQMGGYGIPQPSTGIPAGREESRRKAREKRYGNSTHTLLTLVSSFLLMQAASFLCLVSYFMDSTNQMGSFDTFATRAITIAVAIICVAFTAILACRDTWKIRLPWMYPVIVLLASTISWTGGNFGVVHPLHQKAQTVADEAIDARNGAIDWPPKRP